MLNIQIYYPWQFSFVPAHYYASFVFLAALALHIAVKLPVMARSFREHGALRPLRQRLAEAQTEPVESSESVATEPAAPTISRRGLIGAVGAASLGLGAMMAGQSIGGPFRSIALLAPRGRDYGSGPNDFQVNKTLAAAGLTEKDLGPDWRLTLTAGDREVELSRDQLLAMPQRTETLPIACVEGWSYSAPWRGVRIRDLLEMAGAEPDRTVLLESLEPRGVYRTSTLNAEQAADRDTLLATHLDGEPLALDHGFPCRLIAPSRPGVLQTKWVTRIEVI